MLSEASSTARATWPRLGFTNTPTSSQRRRNLALISAAAAGLRARGGGRDQRQVAATLRAGRRIRKSQPGPGGARGRGRLAQHGSAQRRGGSLLLHRGGAQDRRQGDQGGSRQLGGRDPRRRGLPQRFPPV